MTEEVFILGAKRTPIGAFQGELSSIKATLLGSIAIQGALENASIQPSTIEDVFMGCVLTAGLGQAPARQAAIGAGIPVTTPATTINKVCGSGMESVILASALIRLGDIDVAIAGGMENMSQTPYLLDKARKGYRMGHGEIKDHMLFDGLENVYDGCLMGRLAENAARKYELSRQDQETFASQSASKAIAAIQSGELSEEIQPVAIDLGKKQILVEQDECPSRVKVEKFSSLKPSFEENGTITPATSSQISDGAAALVLGSRSFTDDQNLHPQAKIIAHTSVANEPEWFSTAPIKAIETLLEKVNWRIEDVDLFEINEAFSVVPMAAIRALKIPPEKVNINGGSTALGHPIGASGARILVTLLYTLKKRTLRRGIATLCIGGGEATAIAIERIP